MSAFKTYYAERRLGSKRYRDRTIETNATNVMRLLDNVRWTLGKGQSVCGLDPQRLLQSGMEQPDSQASEEQPPTIETQDRGRKRPAARKRSIMRKVRIFGRGRRVRLHSQANSMIDSWSDLEASQQTTAAELQHPACALEDAAWQDHVERG